MYPRLLKHKPRHKRSPGRQSKDPLILRLDLLLKICEKHSLLTSESIDHFPSTITIIILQEDQEFRSAIRIEMLLRQLILPIWLKRRWSDLKRAQMMRQPLVVVIVSNMALIAWFSQTKRWKVVTTTGLTSETLVPSLKISMATKTCLLPLEMGFACRHRQPTMMMI